MKLILCLFLATSLLADSHTETQKKEAKRRFNDYRTTTGILSIIAFNIDRQNQPGLTAFTTAAAVFYGMLILLLLADSHTETQEKEANRRFNDYGSMTAVLSIIALNINRQNQPDLTAFTATAAMFYGMLTLGNIYSMIYPA